MKIDNSFLAASRIGPSLEQVSGTKDDTEKKGIAGGFEKIFDDLWNATAEASAPSRADTAKLMMGEVDDLPKMQVTGEKSSIMFEYNIIVRNKVMDAYSEIQKTPV